MGYPCGTVCWRGTGSDEVPTQEGRRDCGPLVTKHAARHLIKKVTDVPCPKPMELDPMVLEASEKGDGTQVEIRGDSKTVADWIYGRRGMGGGGQLVIFTSNCECGGARRSI